jgi:outer membrane protein insertion porin family
MISRPLRQPEGTPPVGTSVAYRNLPAASYYRIDPAALINAPEEDEFVVRGQSPVYRSQSIDQYGQPIPQNPIYNNSPQGDPYGDAMRGVYEPGFVDVNIDVTEGRTGRLMFGVGVNSDAGVVGSLTFQEDNFDIMRPPSSWADVIEGRAFRGNGQSFRIEAVPGDQVSRYMVSWTDPFFMYTDYSVGVSGFYFNRFYSDWTEDRLGGRVSVGRLLSRYWSINGAMRLENVDIRNTPAVAPDDLEDVEGDNFLSTGMVTLSYDSRNSAFAPSEGTLFEGSYEQAFGEFDYPRFEVTGSQYWTIFERPDGFGKHTFNLRGQVGWSGNGTPIFERFYAGGYSSLRGWAFRGVTPREMGVRVGGNFQFLGTAEYMLPVTASDSVRAVVFSDFGTVEENATFEHFRVSAGFGVRLTIPAMGPAPLAFDFAFPIVDEPEDNRRIFSFYIGLTR